ncbi:Transposon TX1 uncharacterized 149 kDa protein [Vitis vinifera]|uniref:Transposon TX1 uncharacterized 149 kDa protein n=1 Tax=Vitis vinifera TaxID=29760 RepID=A0A438IP62_VITVI|nr:Transposon TX1 uncharacterized 149 kDa protein [Vitis vinifera]
MWLQHPSFKECFKSWWRGFQGTGWEGHKFMRKLQFVKTNLKEWNKVSFGVLNERKKNILNEIANFDAIEQEGGLTSELLVQRALRKGELEELISREEIHWRQKVKLDGDKASGPDGFTIAVFQDCWDVIKEDLVRVFAEFHNSGIINQSTNASFIVLLPKKSMTKKISDFRPISLITSLYKIIVKVLSERLRGKRRSREEGVVFKIDFEKAYDHVSWDILDHVLEKKGFSPRWRKWMRGCLSTVSFAVLVNGNAKGLVELLDCKASGWPIPYLGLPLRGNPKACGFWDPVIERISIRLDGWQKAYLSFGGVGEGKRNHLVSWDVVFFPTKFVWNSQIPFKVKSFVWLVAHKKVNANDLLQLRRPYKALSPDISSQDGLGSLRSISDMLSINYNGFGLSKRGTVLWQAACITIIWVVWRKEMRGSLRIKQGIQRVFGILFISLLLFGLFVSRSLKGLSLLCYNLIG